MLQQLNSVDSIFIFSDSPRTPMHVGPFFIYDVSTAPNGAVRFKDILNIFKQRLPLVPVLRRKVMRVPFDLDEPYWVDDPDFDLEQHILHVALPKPGNRRQLNILLARLVSAPMNLNRPPWDAYVIEGLDNVEGLPKGSFAMLVRIHHAAIDGESGHALFKAIHDLSPKGTPVIPKTQYKPAEIPSQMQLLSRTYAHLLGKPGNIAKVITNAVSARQRINAVKRENPGEQRLVPKTRFSGKVSTNRVLLSFTLDLETFRTAKNAVEGATVNDAVICMVSGAMRRYLVAKGELPKESMSSIMPINVRTEADRGKPGNVVAITTINMNSNIADPLRRLEAIHASAIYTKAYHNAVGARIMTDVANSLPAGLTSLGLRVAASSNLIDKSPANTMITNVPGPTVPLYLAGAKMVEFQSAGVLLDGVGLFHAIQSYCGRVCVTILADRRMMPDPEFYEECLNDAYEELRAMTGKRSGATASTPKRKTSVAINARKPTKRPISPNRPKVAPAVATRKPANRHATAKR